MEDEMTLQENYYWMTNLHSGKLPRSSHLFFCRRSCIASYVLIKTFLPLKTRPLAGFFAALF